MYLFEYTEGSKLGKINYQTHLNSINIIRYVLYKINFATPTAYLRPSNPRFHQKHVHIQQKGP
jgi:hypothetical protein